MLLEYLVSALVTLLVVVDPIGLAPTFLSVTQGVPVEARTRIAFRAVAITLPAFRIAGGLLLFAVASEMVLGVRIQRQSKQAEEAIEEHLHDVAAFPLAIPLMAGPGAITATLLLAGRARDQPLELAALLGMIIVVIATCFCVFWIANRIERLLGVTGSVVLSRLLGVLLAALAVQFVIDGVRVVLKG
jgi:multiple antibiotic resistance protein